MLKIQRSANGDVVFTLSGRLDKEHIDELDALLQSEEGARRIVLDLKDVTLAGQEGIDFLVGCEERHITLMNCSPYVRKWMFLERAEQKERGPKSE